MRILIHCTIACLLVLSFTVNAQAKTPEQEGRYTIYVLTMDQGDPLFTRFGHIALVVEDRLMDTQKVYNYGTFDFDDPDLKVRYLKGFLNYWLSVGNLRSTLRFYKRVNRTSVLRTLNLTPAQAAEVAKRLRINALPENRVYAYRHYIDNCCTRIRDIIDDVTDGALSKGRRGEPTGNTYRDWTRDATRNLPVMGKAILFILGPEIDKPITRYDEQFLPKVVAEDLDTSRLGSNGEPLVAEKRVLFTRSGPPVGASIPPMDLAIIVGLFGLLAIGLVLPTVIKRHGIAARLIGFGLVFWGLVAGLGGTALVFLWGFTTHYDTHYNENLLVMPFLHLWLIVPGLKLLFVARLAESTKKFLMYYLVAALALIALDVVLKIGPFIQDNWGFLTFAALCDLFALAAMKQHHLIPSSKKKPENS
jgi:hypothetical protein